MAASPPPALVVRGLTFRHERGAAAEVEGVSLTVRAGRTFGVLGANECGKTTLAQILLGNLLPESGTFSFATDVPAAAAPAPRLRTAAAALLRLLLLLSVGVPALAAAWRGVASAAPFVPLLLLLPLAWRRWQRRRAHNWGAAAAPWARGEGWAPAEARRRGVAYISSEHDAAQRLPAELTIEELIGGAMPLPPAAAATRRAETLAALRASGFQMFAGDGTPVGNAEEYLAQGLTVGQLSGGQKHLVYILSVLASRPSFLICDEMLCGLDIDRQASVLRLLQALQVQTGLSVLYLTVDAPSAEIMAHSLSFMRRGRFLETGRVPDLLETPSCKATRAYLQASAELEERSRGKNLRNAYRTGTSVFAP